MALVLRAEEVFAVGDIPKAQNLMAQALQAAPNHPDVLTAFGSMLAEAGNVEKAILTLSKAIHLQPHTGFEKFMCVARPPHCYAY
jgi:Flp pilus assembly protein TadD